MTVSASATGRANSARCSRAPRSRTSANGATRGLAPPSISSSAASSAVLQLGERGSAEHRGEQQAVGLQGAADLQQGAGQVVDEMQREPGHDQVERLIGERQRLLVGLHARAVALRQQAGRGLHVDDHLDARHAAQPPPQQAVISPEIERDGEPAVDRRQTLDEVVGDAGEQEIMIGGAVRHAIASRNEQAPVEDVMIRGHRWNLVRRWRGSIGNVRECRCHQTARPEEVKFDLQPNNHCLTNVRSHSRPASLLPVPFLPENWPVTV